MQLLCTFDTADYTAWKSAFDDRAEGRSQAGLTLLQLWQDADHSARAVALFEVNDRVRAEAWLKHEAQLHSPVTGHFLRTA